MTFLSITEEIDAVLNRLRLKDETDDALIKRIVEYARCYMIIKGAEDMDEESKIEGDLKGTDVYYHGLGGPVGLDWIGFNPLITGDMPPITGDLYSSCPKCGAMDTEYLGTEAMDPKYKCKKCGNVFFPHMKFFTGTKLERS